jgi:pimeloyl-ACP methyl ester carboxylesterase
MLGISYDAVAFDGPLGRYPAWSVPGADSTWVVYVHGRGANRAEGLRTLGVLAARGLPGLLVCYRNDPGAPASPDGYSHLGLTEWQDLEAAVRYALAHGARDVVLSGYSMGGQVVMQFLSRSPLAGRVAAVVLESPLLDWNVTLAHRARALGVPRFGTWLGKSAATLRAGIRWNELDAAARAGSVRVPVLVFHCVHDDIVPVSVSERFARALPARTTLVRVPAGNHVEAWNADPARYSEVLNAWFTARGIGRNVK